MKVGEMTLAQLEELLEAVSNLDLSPRWPTHGVRHLDGCAAIDWRHGQQGGECNCGMAELWMARLAVKEGL